MTGLNAMLRRGTHVQSLVIGFVIGLNAALPMYLWQSNTQLAVACFVIVGYTAWMVAASRAEMIENYSMRRHLCGTPLNRPWRRVGRMLADPGFWWSLTFGSATITGAVWYAQWRQPEVLITVGVLWSLVSVLLNFGLTLLSPTTRCRRCNYQLLAHLDPDRRDQVIKCPECGTLAKKADLLLLEPLTSEPRQAA